MQRMPDCIEHPVAVVDQLVVPDAEDAVAGRRQPPITRFVPDTVGVLTAVELDDQHGLGTHEIDDIPANRHLATELEIHKAAVAHYLPE